MNKFGNEKAINEIIKNRIKKIASQQENSLTLKAISNMLGMCDNYLSSVLGSSRVINLEILYDCAGILMCDVTKLIPSINEIETYVEVLSGNVKEQND